MYLLPIFNITSNPINLILVDIYCIVPSLLYLLEKCFLKETINLRFIWEIFWYFRTIYGMKLHQEFSHARIFYSRTIFIYHQYELHLYHL